jgi:hypothetical protein
MERTGEQNANAMDPAKLGLRFIDIKTRSIVQAPKDAKYAALSYVWGQDATDAEGRYISETHE